MADHGGKGYEDSDFDLKTKEISLARNMPLLSEFTRYGKCETAGKDGRISYITAH